jgi:hypothetical protein
VVAAVIEQQYFIDVKVIMGDHIAETDDFAALSVKA